jgi:Zn-dependent oligopeptidase
MRSSNENAVPLLEFVSKRIEDELLNNLLLARYNLAKLVGFPTYAHRAINGTMAETPGNVHSEFVDTSFHGLSKNSISVDT